MTHAAFDVPNGGHRRSQGEIVWNRVSRKNMWMDAMREGNRIVAVFCDERLWPGPGLSILGDASVTRAQPIALGGKCRQCGGNAYGLRACPKCGDTRCTRCGKCGCGAPVPVQRSCAACHEIKPNALFERRADICRECAG